MSDKNSFRYSLRVDSDVNKCLDIVVPPFNIYFSQFNKK